MIFLTVGTSLLQFDRLVKGMDIAVRDGLIEDEVYAQVGACKYKPKYMKYIDIMDKNEFDSFFGKASSIVGHAGMGTITMALENDKPVLVMARMAEFKEHVNDHQVSTAEMFEKLGHVLVAQKVEELSEKIRELKYFKPVKRDATPNLVADRVADFLKSIS